jgi:hypothetical protein
MIDDEAYVELAKWCTRACHVLKTATDGRSVDSLTDSSKKQADNLGRCVHPVNSFLPIITSDTRTIRHIESVVCERASCAPALREHYPGPTQECIATWQTETQEILRFFDVRGCRLTVPTITKLHQGDLELDNALVAGENESRVQGSSKTKPYKYVPNGLDIPAVPEPSFVLLLCLISGAVPQDERTSLIEAILSSGKVTDMVRGHDAQAFIDIVYEVRCHSSIPGNGSIDFAISILSPNSRWQASILHQRSEKEV